MYDKPNMYDTLNIFANGACSHCLKIVVFQDWNRDDDIGLKCWTCPDCEMDVVSFNKGVEN